VTLLGRSHKQNAARQSFIHVLKPAHSYFVPVDAFIRYD
jgi:hypothetical protein